MPTAKRTLETVLIRSRLYSRILDTDDRRRCNPNLSSGLLGLGTTASSHTNEESWWNHARRSIAAGSIALDRAGFGTRPEAGQGGRLLPLNLRSGEI
jgi:hypothetical protein